jgi:CD63 antigen
MVQGGMKCIKYILFLFNLLFVIFGVVLIVAGTVTKTGYNKYIQFLNSDGLSAPPNLFIVAGSVMLLIAFLGCCGAVRENHCMIMTYSVLVGLLLIMELGAGIAAFALEDDVEQMVSSEMTKSMKEYHHNKTEVIKAWNIAQTSLECCGITNYTDWSTAYDPNYPLIPESCCKGGASDNCTQAITDKNLDDATFAETIIYVHGCLPKVVADIAITRIGQIGIALAIVELVGVVFACFMARSIRYSYETV